MTKTVAVGSGQCTAHARSGERCKRFAVAQATVCNLHGGKSPAVVERQRRAAVHHGLALFTHPIDAADLEANPLNAFDVEFRRTIAAIRFCDAQIEKLSSSEDLVWGVTKIDSIGATEFAGQNVSYESKINAWEAKRFTEREHLTDLLKLWITAKLSEKKLAIEASTLDALQHVIDAVLISMNADPHDPKIRTIVTHAIDTATATPV